MAQISRKIASLAAALAAYGLAHTVPINNASAQELPRSGWYKVCAKQEENDVCNVQIQVVASSGQIITSINLVTVRGQVNRSIFQITVPTNRLLPPGVVIKVDDGKDIRLPFIICLPDRCTAEVGLDNNLVNLLKGGGEMIVTSTNFQNRPNPIRVTLEGFTAAFDGPPLAQNELEDRQQQLQEELQRRANDARQRLQEAQDAAKSE